MDEKIDKPLIQDLGKQNKFVAALWIFYIGMLCVVLLVENSLLGFIRDERVLLAFVVLLYTTYYFSCRAKGNNFLYQLWGLKPSSQFSLLMSDFGAVVIYLFFFGIIIWRI